MGLSEGTGVLEMKVERVLLEDRGCVVSFR